MRTGDLSTNWFIVKYLDSVSGFAQFCRRSFAQKETEQLEEVASFSESETNNAGLLSFNCDSERKPTVRSSVDESGAAYTEQLFQDWKAEHTLDISKHVFDKVFVLAEKVLDFGLWFAKFAIRVSTLCWLLARYSSLFALDVQSFGLQDLLRLLKVAG